MQISTTIIYLVLAVSYLLLSLILDKIFMVLSKDQAL